MRNKKGFTLVELVIVIAVIAILAGVMIGTFASVVKKAKESAKMQEMTAQKQEQIANDIDQKLKNAEWLGWEDFETKLADVMADTFKQADISSTNVKEAVNDAVEKAFAKYASSIGTSNTGLTADQVKYIVETALSNKSYSGVTAEQVKAIVNNATSGLSNLNKSQVQAIVDAAQAKNLTLAQVSAVVNAAKEDLEKNQLTEATVNAAVTEALKEFKASTLTEKEISDLLAKYVSNGIVKGDYTWYNANATTMAIDADATKAADQLVALSTMAKGGTSFKGKTIELPAAVDLTKTDFQPIMDFDGTLKGATKTENNKTVPATTVKVNVTPVWNTLDGRNGKTMMNYLKADENGIRKDAVGYGFVASLVDGGVVENVHVVLAVDNTGKDPGNRYTYFGGIVGFLDGGTIRNCTVSGKITAYNRIGGVVGYAKSGTIENVNVDNLTIDSRCNKGEEGYSVAGGLIGYASAGEVVIKDCTVSATVKLNIAGNDLKGNIVGQLDAWKNTAKGGYKSAGYTEWDATGAKTHLVLTNVTVGTGTKPLDKTAENFGNFAIGDFADRITIN